jgi:16S rRNA (uracil1498-N3)-methyltransferase
LTVNILFITSIIMTRIRLHVPSNFEIGQSLTLDQEQSHYVTRVLRLKTGKTVTVFNGRGGEWDARISTATAGAVQLEVGAHRDTATESSLRIHLVQGISRGERMDWVVQKATELGVKRLSPVLTDYGVVKLDEHRAAKRRDHWQKIAVSAAEQSGRTRPPLIDLPVPMKTWFGAVTSTADTDLILDPSATTSFATISAPVIKACLLIGPEGGFSEAEYGDAAAAGFTSVSLGPRVLRTETAAVVVLAVAQALWGDLR